MPTQPTFTCATCDDRIAHHPVFHLGLAFCCAGCAADGPCMCSYDAVTQPASPVATAGVRVTAVGQIAGRAPAIEPAGVAATATAPRDEPRRRPGGRRPAEEPALVDAGR